MLKQIAKRVEDGATVTEYACDFVVNCAGDSIWSNTEGLQVRVTGITVIEEDLLGDGEIYTSVNVTHDAGWEIYTDTGFETAISEAVGFAVTFTEQGMQDDNYASMEA